MADQHEGDQPKDDTPDSSPLAVTPSAQKPPEATAQNHEPDTNAPTAANVARQLHWLEKLNIVGQLSLVAVGIIAAGIYGCQLHTMNDQLQQMKADSRESSKQFRAELGHYDASLGVTQLLAQHAGEQSASADKAAKAAEVALGVARRTLDVTNRPWIDSIITQKGPLIFGPNGASITVGFQMRDVGHTPATHIRYHASIVSLPNKTWQMVEVKAAERNECDSFSRYFFVGGPTLYLPCFPTNLRPKSRIGLPR